MAPAAAVTNPLTVAQLQSLLRCVAGELRGLLGAGPDVAAASFAVHRAMVLLGNIDEA
jgi:hypothetical protein